MKNIQGTEDNLELFDEDGIRVYAYRKGSDGLFQELTFDSNQNILTYKDSDGLTRAFDKFYLFWCVGFIKRAVEYYWQDWNQEHPDNENDFKLTQQILNK